MCADQLEQQTIRLGPGDHGRRMSLELFTLAEGGPGHQYELSKGVVVVVEIPGLPHGQILLRLDRQLFAYDAANTGVISYMAPGSDCALRLPSMQSERHPDRAIYLSPPPDPVNPWALWVPEIVVEVVSKGQEARDYGEKREEYLAAGVREYWIIDPRRRAFVPLQREGDRWRETELTAADSYRPALLAGLELRIGELFE